MMADFLSYGGTFYSVVPASERALVTGRMTLPNQDIPIVFIEMAGIGYQTKGNEGSYQRFRTGRHPNDVGVPTPGAMAQTGRKQQGSRVVQRRRKERVSRVR